MSDDPPRFLPDLRLLELLRRAQLARGFCLAVFILATAINLVVLGVNWAEWHSWFQLKRTAMDLGIVTGLPTILALLGFVQSHARHRSLLAQLIQKEEGKR